MQQLQIRMNMQSRRVVVVGATEPAAQLVATLLETGIDITVVAPVLNDALRREAANGRIDWQARTFESEDPAGAQLVFAASDCPQTNRQVREAAARHGCLCNDVSTNEGDFSLAAPVPPPPSAEHDDPWRHTRVCLVGAGPGDPGLLTVDGYHALRSADVVLHDRLVSAELLETAPPSAQRIFVGKQRDRHHYRQEDINALMIELARAGRRVVRLKGGDPFIFGRGGEELTVLTEAGIACRVIPGITAGSGCATYADIPLTHRDYAHSCQFITACGKDGESEHDWAALVRSRHTLVVYMGLAALQGLCPRLIEHGLPADTPAALVERGTTPRQRVLTGTVESLPELSRTHTLQSPAVLIIGDVVRLRERLQTARQDAPDPSATPGAADGMATPVAR